MSNKNIVIDLEARRDKDDKVYYIGKIRAPVLINCSEGAAFLIFVSDEGQETMQISAIDSNKKDNNHK